MKGINLKKIGAIVAGATILASSVAFAGSVLHGNTALVTDSGQPVATVVVGSGASASDGVAAANIATHLASEAFMTSTYTAMAGDVSCVASEAEGAGSCVITDKSVTLDVTVPGATVTGSHTMNTLIGDYVDRTLGNRAQGSQQEVYNLSTTETSEFANPNANGAGSALSGAPSAQFLHRISGSDFAPMATYTMNDEDASTSYTQTQDFWVGSTSNGGNVQWDGSEDALVLDLPIVEYSLDFSGSGNDFGIPVCTQAVNGSFYADCETNSGSTLDNSYATSSHKVKLMFLGEEWIISDMSPPTTGSLTSVQTLQNGGYVKIAKESQQGILNKGEFLTVGDLKFVLDDVSLATGAANLHPAIVSVYAEGVEDALKEAQINPDTTQDVSVPGYGTYKIHVYKTAPGYTFGATWADMAVFSDELKLEDGQDVDADLGNNDLWEVSLGWKNRGAGDSGDDGMADHLRTIIIHTDDADDAPGLDDWVAGESLAVIQDPAAWQLSFAGLDIDDDDRESLKFKLVDDGSSKDLELNSSADCNITVPYATVEVPDNHPMGLTGATGSGSSTTGYDNEAYVALDTIVCPSGTYQAGSLAMKTGSSSTSYYVFKNNTDTLDLTWSFMGSTEAYSTGGAIRVSHNMTHATSANMGVNMSGETAKSALTFGVSENTGGVSDTAAVMVFGVNVSGSSSTFNFDGTSTSLLDEDHIYVNTSGPVTSDGTQEEGYITERGSIFKSIDDDSVEFSIANKVANAQVTLASADAADAAPNTVTLTMSEGESQTISGTDVTVSVVSIAATGSCDTGAGATPVCEVSGDASAYLVDSEGANMGDTLTASTAYEGDLSGLVALDSDVTAGTLISVGGPAVNSVTAGVEGDLALNAPGDTVVTEVGNTIVVAGYTAEDTMAAAAEFLAGLQ